MGQEQNIQHAPPLFPNDTEKQQAISFSPGQESSGQENSGLGTAGQGEEENPHSSPQGDNMQTALKAIGHEKEGTVPSTLCKLFAVWAGKRKVELLVGVGISLVAMLLGIGILSFAVLRVAGSILGSLFLGVWVLRALGIGRVVSRYGERLYTHNAMFKALMDLRVWFFKAIAQSSSAGLAFLSSGDLLSRLVTDISALDGLYLRILLPFCNAVLAWAVLVGVALYCHAYTVAVILGGVFGFSAFGLPAIMAAITYKISRQEGVQQARLRVTVLDLAMGLREIRAFGAEERMLDRITEQERSLEAIQLRQIRAAAFAGGGAFLAMQGGMAFILIAAMRTDWGLIAPIAAVFIVFLLVSANELVAGLTRSGVQAGTIVRAAQRIMGVTAGRSLSSQASGKKAMPADLTIQFKNVVYTYPGRKKPVFNGLNLTIKPGSHIALLGSSGVGKSTLVAMLLGLVKPQQGSISIGGVDLSELNGEEVRNHISWLSQATHIFDDTIRANLLLGKDDASEQDLWQALDHAAIGDMVRSLPEGLDTWLGEGGIKVSGGQGRRIALARILLRDAPILLLDEPTTGLDSTTEREFLALLNQIEPTRSLILITHRLTGVEKLDQVWMMENSVVHPML